MAAVDRNWPKCAVHEAGEMIELEHTFEFQGRPPVIRAVLISSVYIVSGMVRLLWRQPDFGPVPAFQLGIVILGGVASKSPMRSLLKLMSFSRSAMITSSFESLS
jgi:hypothetical protein